MTSDIRPHRNEDEPGPKLRHTEPGRMNQPPLTHVPKLVKAIQNGLAVGVEPRARKSLHVLEHHCTWRKFFYETERLREQVSFVLGTQLLACHGERRARHSSRQEVCPGNTKARDLTYVTLMHVPIGTVRSKRRRGVTVNLDGEHMPESRLLKSDRLPSCARTNLDYRHFALRHDHILPLFLSSWKQPLRRKAKRRSGPSLVANDQNSERVSQDQRSADSVGTHQYQLSCCSEESVARWGSCRDRDARRGQSDCRSDKAGPSSDYLLVRDGLVPALKLRRRPDIMRRNRALGGLHVTLLVPRLGSHRRARARAIPLRTARQRTAQPREACGPRCHRATQQQQNARHHGGPGRCRTRGPWREEQSSRHSDGHGQGNRQHHTQEALGKRPAQDGVADIHGEFCQEHETNALAMARPIPDPP